MNAEEFDSVWLPLNGSFYRLALYILENEDDARDAVQDLYLNLWKDREVLDCVANPKAYGLRLLRNRCIDRIRCSSRHPSSPLGDFSGCTEWNADSRLDSDEDMARVMKSLGALPEKQRRLLGMRAFEGMSYADIAKRTGLSSVNVRVTVAMARKSLKEKLKQE